MPKEFIMLPRKICEYKGWIEGCFDDGKAMIDLMMLADPETGIIPHGISKLATRWKWTRQKVRSYVDRQIRNKKLQPVHNQFNNQLGKAASGYISVVNHEANIAQQPIEKPVHNQLVTLPQPKINGKKKTAPRRTNCPYEEIFKRYNQMCPSLSQIQSLTDKRRIALCKNMWERFDGLTDPSRAWERIEKLFSFAQRMPGMRGEGNRVDPNSKYKGPFRGKFQFITKDDWITDILEQDTWKMDK